MRYAPVMFLLVALMACESVEPSGEIFAPVHAPPPSVAAPVDPELAFPVAPPLQLTSEQLAKGSLDPATATGVKVEEEPVAEPVAAPVAAPAPVGVPSLTQWPVRLVSTIPQAQPPRAILGLPSGEERVVSPGAILAEQGLVVVSVSADRVGLAKITPAGDHAVIESLELTAQYPAR